ncbi:MAG: TIGR02147 family protein [Bacteriovoracaceae bacterium]|nr:TIGR02147 family protein [Bacteriovoracaceae bacterium]
MNDYKYYVDLLNNELRKRSKQNPQYSMRAFAANLNIHPASLSSILKGKRKVPTKRLFDICKYLKLKGNDREAFILSSSEKVTSLRNIKVNIRNSKQLDDSYNEIITDWEYYAFLNLIKLKNFKNDLDWIAGKLDITKKRAEDVINKLIEKKLVEKNEKGDFVRTCELLSTKDGIPSNVLRSRNKKLLTLALKKIDKVDLDLRSYSSIVMPINRKKIKEAKIIIEEFKQKLCFLLDENSTDIYLCGIQLIPLTKIDY